MIVIIGNGVAGVSTALTIRKKSNEEICIISKETDFFFSRTALMYIYMGHIRFEDTKPYEDQFWFKNNIQLLRDEVKSINYSNKEIVLTKSVVNYKTLVLATGSKPRFLNWKNQDFKGVQGLYSFQDLELLEVNSKQAKAAVIIGGGLIGIELAEMLLTRNIEVHFLIREQKFWHSVLPKEDSDFLIQHFQHHKGFHLHFEEELAEIIGENAKLKSIKTSKGNTISCDILGITIGVEPNIEFLMHNELKINKGILVNEFLQTNIEDVYACGDCVELQQPNEGRRAIEQLWYTAKMMGECVGKNILGEKTTYNPGIWFNSAKFFDIEYQTYGNVSAKLPENETSFIYQPNNTILLHFRFHSNNLRFIGINNFGIRLRHELFQHALQNNWTIEQVLADFNQFLFDPEFYKNHSDNIISNYNQQFNKNIKLKAKTWWQQLIS